MTPEFQEAPEGVDPVLENEGRMPAEDDNPDNLSSATDREVGDDRTELERTADEEAAAAREANPTGVYVGPDPLEDREDLDEG